MAAVLDTNILLYAISTDPAEVSKRDIAQRLTTATEWGTSTQLLQEFYVNATRGKKPTLTVEEASEAVDLMIDMHPCAGMHASTIQQAIRIRQRYQISYWDAAVIAAAITLGAKVLYSEDLNHGQVYEGVRVENPFLEFSDLAATAQ